MKRALVTGSDGFIGRWMCRELTDRGWDVTGMDIAYSGFYGNVLWLKTKDWSVFDLVVHCAYRVGGRAGIDGVNINFAHNLQLDGTLFEWAIRTRQRHVLYFSSSAAYPVSYQTKDATEWNGLGGYTPMLREDDIRLDGDGEPDANYGWAKVTGERLARDARKHGLAVTVVRPFSGYGEGQSADYPFPSILRRAKDGDLTVWGPPGQTRDWIHVSDVVRGALAVVEASTPDPVNLCTGEGVEMGDLARLAFRLAHGNTAAMPEVKYDESKPTGVFYRVGDPTRMLQYYEPVVSLADGIQRTLKHLAEVRP